MMRAALRRHETCTASSHTLFPQHKHTTVKPLHTKYTFLINFSALCLMCDKWTWTNSKSFFAKKKLRKKLMTRPRNSHKPLVIIRSRPTVKNDFVRFKRINFVLKSPPDTLWHTVCQTPDIIECPLTVIQHLICEVFGKWAHLCSGDLASDLNCVQRLGMQL